MINKGEDGYSAVTWGETSGAACGAVTDDEGAYRIEGVDPQALLRSVPIYDADETPLATGIELNMRAAGDTLVWNYTIAAPITVKGLVKLRTSGRPSAGVTIVCKRANEEDGFSIPLAPVQAVTGADGVFEMHLTSGADTYDFGVQAVTGFLCVGQRQLRHGETASLNLTLPGSWSRSFLVLDELGNPLAGVAAYIAPEERPPTLFPS